MPNLYQGREWIHQPPPQRGRKPKKEVQRITCTICSKDIPASNYSRHVGSKKCMTDGWQHQLEQEGWEPHNQAWTSIYQDGGVELRRARILMVPAWANVLLYTCVHKHCRNVPRAYWLSVFKDRPAAQRLLMKQKFYVTIRNNTRAVSSLPFIALTGNVDKLVEIAARAGATTPGHRQIYAWLSELIPRLRDRIIILDSDERDELRLVAQRLFVYVNEMDVVCPGRLHHSNFDFGKAIRHKAQELLSCTES